MTLCRLLLIPLSLGLFACASQEPKPPKTSESFTTLIQTDNTKQFSYTLIMELPERGGRPRGGPGMGGRGDGKGPGGKDGPPPEGKGPTPDGDVERDDDRHYDSVKHLTEEGLLAKLEDTGYCRNGYHPLETQSRRGAMNITGECYDQATDADRQAFPNPAPKKVIEETLD